MKNFLNQFKQSTKNISFKELIDFEEDFAPYYDRYLKKHFIELDHRQNFFLTKIYRLLIRNLSIFIVSLFSCIFIYQSHHLSKMYNNLGNIVDSILLNYHNWWLSTHFLIQIILPSKITFWSFPSPLTIFILLTIALLVNAILPIFRFRESMQNKLPLATSKFMGPAEINVIPTKQEDWYDSLILPSYTFPYIEPKVINLWFGDHLIAVNQLSLFERNSPSFTQSKTVKFMGLMISIPIEQAINDFSMLMISNPSQSIAALMQDDSELIAIDTKYEDILTYVSKNPDNKFDFKINEMVEQIKIITNFINQHNQLQANLAFDQKLANSVNRIHVDLDNEYSSSVQLTVNDNKISIMIPTNRNLFAANSLFSQNHYHDDIHLLLASLYFGIIIASHFNILDTNNV